MDERRRICQDTYKIEERASRDRELQYSLLMGGRARMSTRSLLIIGHWITADFQPRHRLLDFQEVEGPDTGENLASIVYTVL